jgi:UTP:GlnB (protein PII) uridylyltransferase
MTDIQVRFIEDSGGSLREIVIEHPLRTRGIERIWSVLLEHQVDITGAQVGAAGSRVRVRLVVTGRRQEPVREQQRAALQASLLEALGSAHGPLAAAGGSSEHRLGLTSHP